MEFFQRAKVFRLKCRSQTKYLVAPKDEETVQQSRKSSSEKARWTYELVEGKPNLIRLRSCCTWRYLAATEESFLLGMTGKKVMQTITQGPAIEWEPIKEGLHIRLKSHTGSMLRANRGPPPWRNSVTHDEPDHWTGTENMTLWIVDIIEIDYQSPRKDDDGDSTSVEMENGIYDPFMSYNEADQKGDLSSSYFSSLGSFEVNVSASNTNSPTEHSDSFIKLKSMLSALDDELTVKEPNDETVRNVPKYSVLEVKKSKKTFEQLKTKDFRTLLSLGREEELEKAVNVLISDAKYTGNGKIPTKLVGIDKQLKAMKNDYNSASQDLVEYSTFSTRRLEIRTELKKHASVARELENFEVEITNTIMDAKSKRAELLKQLEETENTIEKVEKSQRDNLAEVEELVSIIGKKSEELMEMESKEKSWRVRKNEAERILERVEEDWNKAKRSFQMYDEY